MEPEFVLQLEEAPTAELASPAMEVKERSALPSFSIACDWGALTWLTQSWGEKKSVAWSAFTSRTM